MGQAQVKPFASAARSIAGQSSDPNHAGDVDDLTGDHLLVPGVHQLVCGPEGISVEACPDIAVEGIPLDLVPYDLKPALVQPLQDPDLMPQVIALQFSALQLQPWPLVATLQGNRPLPQAVAQCARYELS